MIEEMFDIVDADNKPTGEVVSRSEAHARGLWHRTVQVYFYRVHDKGIEYLVHLRAKTKDANPDKWITRFGGHVKAGESVIQAAVAEVKEEVGIDINPQDLEIGLVRHFDSPTNREHGQTYFYRFNGALEDLHFLDGEVQEAKWMNVEDIVESIRKNSEQWVGSVKGFQETLEWLRASFIS